MIDLRYCYGQLLAFKLQMSSFCLVLIMFFCSSLATETYAQWAVRLDPLNLVLKNYNLGMEYKKDRIITGFDVSYINMGPVWQSEFPGFAKSAGVRLNVDYKKTFKKVSWGYAGAMIRLEKLHMKELSHWQAFYTYSRDDQRLIVAGKLGLRMGKGPFKIDFGIGPGAGFIKRQHELLSVDYSYPGLTEEERIAEANRRLAREPHGFFVKVVPMIHLQASMRIEK